MKEKYYITTAIAYTSKIPHIGNVYEAILADAMARFKREQGYDVYFLTGTDEHGQKIEEQAIEAGKSPKEHVDHIASEIKRIWDRMEVSYDKFIRTTDPEHISTVQRIFERLHEKGDIYKGEYEGWYCTPCESFWTESQLEEGNCPDCKRVVNQAREEAYFLKLSKYQSRLEEYIESNPTFIWPESRKNEMLNNFIKPGLQDLCVSRTSFKWGVPVNFDQNHVVYVWIDALSNYISGIGYDVDNPSPQFKSLWPADLHVVGKDIVRFHTIYWPIILMGLDVELPKQVFGHPWLTTGNDKMSKSRGNAIFADDLVELFGVDAVRYYALKEMPFANDGTITYELIISRINTDLVNTLGNLVNRTVAMVHKYFDGVIPSPLQKETIDNDLIDLCTKTLTGVTEAMDSYHVADALEEIMKLLRRSNKYIDETTPWILAKDDSQTARLGTVLYNLLECIRYAGVLLKAFIPDTSKQIFEQIGSEEDSLLSLHSFGATISGNRVGVGKPLFMRIDESQKLKEALELTNRDVSDSNESVCETISYKPEITIDDFSKIDLRVAEIIEASKHPKADKLLVLKLKVATEIRQVVSGIAKDYKPEDLIGQKVILVANLKPVLLRGIESQGMILAASNDSKLKLVTVDMESGTTVS